jgi:hypothetical protein
MVPYAKKEDQARYMSDFRARQSERNAEKDDWIARASQFLEESLCREFVEAQMQAGFSFDQSVGQLLSTITPPDTIQSVETAADSTDSPCRERIENASPEEKPLCFGEHKEHDSDECTCLWEHDCYRTWIANLGRSKADIDAERETRRAQKIIDFLAQSRAFIADSEKRAGDARVQLVKDFYALKEKYPHDWPDLEKRTRGDEYGKPVQPTTIGDLFGKRKKEEVANDQK